MGCLRPEGTCRGTRPENFPAGPRRPPGCALRSLALPWCVTAVCPCVIQTVASPPPRLVPLPTGAVLAPRPTPSSRLLAESLFPGELSLKNFLSLTMFLPICYFRTGREGGEGGPPETSRPGGVTGRGVVGGDWLSGGDGGGGGQPPQRRPDFCDEGQKGPAGQQGHISVRGRWDSWSPLL